ncbi:MULTISPECIES: virulence factor Mce family protein [Mycobacterium]|uniref:virulence factor Mce family protein n=1 Tax=Mycobacterium TaxID=1763 RepID=UPI000A3E5F5B|nr:MULTISPECIES: virulence factor Mce family protein [Mycobacterium]MCA2231394.1 virulence factor Mce family protein [Mycobacterium intracellulare]MCA2255243.1 virulence factor Mce family protein [Mycobacterium intracellulare]MCA2275917.1 virulence factor Mce family protein [Mycobacterium intracellulare]MCA2306851.1 virulence factor Mce family protein [Mycobacterium intracellulare]MCA2327415.1 virulence factor Mce family protein [Mycobacterium intracellulare]
MSPRSARIGVAIALTAVLLGGIVTVVRSAAGVGRTTVVGYFANSTGLYNGDSVVILGVPVGKIEKIEPEPDRVRITFWLNDKYKVPADVKAAILSPSLVTPRSIQLTPAYTGGPALADHAVIPQQRTAVPVEYDDFRQQLEKLTQVLQPTAPGGTSTLGAFINTAADNLRGQGPDIRKTVIELSQAISALGDHSNDLFSTVKNLSILVSALHDSSDLLQQLNQNLAEVTGLLANDPNEVANAVRNLNDVVGDVRGFVAENRDALGTTSDKLASVTQAVTDSLGDVKQILHTAPTAFQNFLNIYQPAQGTLTGALAFNNFANTIQFLCGAVEAASRLGAKESAKLCVQYLAPIIKNRQVNFPPLGENLFVGAAARPNELTYSEDWLRPDYVPPHPDSPPTGDGTAPPAAGATPAEAPPPAADAPAPAQAAPTNPAEGLRGMMMPPGGGQ